MNRVLLAFARARVKPSVYDELQGTIHLVTPPKKRTASSADSAASVAGSVWDAETAKAAVLALRSRGLTKVDACTWATPRMSCPTGSELQPRLRNATAGQVVGQPQKLRAQTSGQ